MADTKLVTFESVANACEAIIAEDDSPSVRKIKNYLGGGSPNAILTHYREWQAGRPQVTDNVIEVSETTLNAIRGDMNRAQTKAAEVAEARASQLEEIVEDLRGEIAGLQHKSADQVELIEEQERQITGLTADNAKLMDQVEQVKESKREAEQRLTAERDQERQRAEGLAEELATAKHKLDQLAGIERERDDLKNELANARDTLTEAEKKAAVAESEAKAEARRAEEAAKREADTLARIEKLETKLDAEYSEATTLREGLATAKEKEAQRKTEITQLTAKIDELNTAGKVQADQIKDLEARLAEAEQDNEKSG